MTKKIVIAAGGTGGHLIPAKATADALKKESGYEIFFVGKGVQNPYVQIHPHQSYEIESGPLSFSLKSIPSIFKILRGIKQSVKVLQELKPTIVIGFGSYHTFPVLIASELLRIPFVLHESNAIPGRVNRLLSKKARWNGVFFSQCQNLLNGTVYTTDIPMRASFLEKDALCKQKSYHYFDLNKEKKTILVFGGSQGAGFINRLVLQTFEHFKDTSTFQVLHFAGNSELIDSLKKRYDELKIQNFVKGFEENMHHAWNISDIVISRSGASTIQESIHFNVPGLFIPFKRAKDNHQKKNALYVQEHLQAGFCLEEESLDSKILFERMQYLLDRTVLDEMKKKLKNHEKKPSFVDLVQQYLKELK